MAPGALLVSGRRLSAPHSLLRGSGTALPLLPSDFDQRRQWRRRTHSIAQAALHPEAEMVAVNGLTAAAERAEKWVTRPPTPAPERKL